MRRLLGIVVHNWPLKLAAIVLATLLYGGLVLSENAQVWTGRVQINAQNQPSSVFILDNLPEVRNIRYFAPRDVAERLSAGSFSAFVDLAGVRPQPGGARLNVQVKASDERVRILDWDPPSILVQLDPLVSKSVPVEVDKGDVPQGLQASDPVVDVSEVTVSGPQSYVNQVVGTVARVVIQPSGISIDQNVDLVAVDARGQEILQVKIDPVAVHVKLIVGTRIGSRALPVRASIVGAPAVGYAVASVAVSPPVVTVQGEATVIGQLGEVDTGAVSISGQSTDITRTVALDLPDGVGTIGEATVEIVVHLLPTTGSRDFTVGIALDGARSDRSYQLSTDWVLATVGGPDVDLNALSGRTLAGSVDVSGLDPGVHDVTVRVNLPRGLSLLSVAPARVLVTVSSSPSPTIAPTASPAGP